MRDIGKNIKALRTEKNMTQDDLAEKLFVTRQTVSNYETGRSRPDVEMLTKIAEVLETDANTVIYGPKPAENNTALRQLLIGCAVTMILFLIRQIAAPYADIIRAQTFTIAYVALIRGLLDPLIWLSAGWTLSKMLTMAVKKGPLKFRYIPHIRRILAVVLIVWFLISVVYIGLFALDDYLYSNKLRGEWVDEPYESNGKTLIGKAWRRIPLPIPKWLETIGMPLLQYNFLRAWTLGILGAALCLCGFPPVLPRVPMNEDLAALPE